MTVSRLVLLLKKEIHKHYFLKMTVLNFILQVLQLIPFINTHVLPRGMLVLLLTTVFRLVLVHKKQAHKHYSSNQMVLNFML
jgi:glyoxylate utilization-related uncharacterized protein